MQRYQHSAERWDPLEPTEGSKTTTTRTYDETDQRHKDVGRILTACKEADSELEVIRRTFHWTKKDRPITAYARTTASHTQVEVVSGIIELLKSLAVVLAEHRDDVKHELQRSAYCRIFVDETSERRVAIRSVITNLRSEHLIGRETYDLVLKHPSKFYSRDHRITYAALLAAVDHLFKGKMNEHFPILRVCPCMMHITGVAQN